MRAPRILVPAIVAVALVPLAAGPALAAPPANDVPGGATAITLGETVTEDTTEATTDPDDAAINENCGAPETGASVWFTYTPKADHKVVFDATDSDYGVGLMIFKGAPTPDSLFECGPFGLPLRAHAGKTYYIMAFNDSDQSGGTLSLSLKNAPTPVVHATLAKRGKAYHGPAGAARLHGTYRCKHDDGGSILTTHLLQRAGRLKIQGNGRTGVLCDGKTHHWSTRIVSPVGTYVRGRGIAKVRIIACGIFQCRSDSAKRHVRLFWASGSHRQPPVTGRSDLRAPDADLAARPHPLFGLHHRWPSR